MFKVEGLRVPSSVKVEDSQKKKNAGPTKLSGDELQSMFSELAPGKKPKPKQKKPELSSKSADKDQKNADIGREPNASAKPVNTSKADAGNAKKQTDVSPPQKKRQGDAQTPSSKRAKPGRKELQEEVRKDSRPTPKSNEKPRADRGEHKAPQSKAETKPQEPLRGPTSTKQLTPLQLKMQQKLTGSRFRWINEQLYTTSSDHAFHIFQEQPQVFQEYHEGFRHQVESWPENPVVSLVQQFKDRLQKPLNAPGGLPADKPSGQITVADMGCGEAELALELSKFKHRKANFKVHSFDLYAANERITAADIANVPLPDESCHVVVFCLALMGTNLVDFLTEGIRVLKPGGVIWIAEIKSRFSGYDTFIDTLKQMGLYHKTTDESNKMFVKFEFVKLPHKMAQASATRPDISLKPCIYKRR